MTPTRPAAGCGDLFAAPEMPALDVEPNECGVYPKEQAERFVLPYPKKNWRGVPTAEIMLLHVPEGWLESSSLHLSDRGHASPMSPPYYTSRAEAAATALMRLERGLNSVDDRAPEATRKAARRAREWLASLPFASHSAALSGVEG